MKKAKWILSLSAALFLSACADVKIRTPVLSVAPSELLRPNNAELSLRGDPARQETTTLDASDRPPTWDNINDGTGLMALGLNYGLIENLQIGLALTTDIGLTGQVAYQFLGKPWAEAQPGWSALVHGDLAYTSASKSGDQNGNFGSGGYPWKATINMSALGAGLSAGYRWNATWMAFAGASYESFGVTTKINQDANSDGSSPGGSYSQTNNGNSMATGVGLMIGSGAVRLIPVAQWVEYKIDDQHSRGIWWGLMLNFGGSK